MHIKHHWMMAQLDRGKTCLKAESRQPSASSRAQVGGLKERTTRSQRWRRNYVNSSRPMAMRHYSKRILHYQQSQSLYQILSKHHPFLLSRVREGLPSLAMPVVSGHPIIAIRYLHYLFFPQRPAISTPYPRISVAPE